MQATAIPPYNRTARDGVARVFLSFLGLTRGGCCFLPFRNESISEKANLRAKVIACYEPHEDDELALEVNEQIEVTNKVQQWWWEGVVKGRKGMFPSNYVMLLPEKEKTEQHNNEIPVEAQVMYDYEAVEPDELTINVGDTITDISVVGDGWWKGVVNGKERIFPSNFLEVCTDTSKSSVQTNLVPAIVVYNHTPRSGDELFLVKDDIIEITSQLDPLWWEGIVNGCQGRFPSYCVAPIHVDGEGYCQQDDATPVKAQVLYDYDAVEPDELTIKVGDTITDIHDSVGGWWEGVLNGKKGRFPYSFVKIHTGTLECFTQNETVLEEVDCCHTPQSDDELSLAEGDRVEIDDRPHPGCWEGIVNENMGHLPSHGVALLPQDKEGEEPKQPGHETPELLQQPLPETEAIVTKQGVTMTIPDTKVVLNIPSGALPEHLEKCVIKMRLIPQKMFKDSTITFSSHSSVVVEILPNNLCLQHPAQLVIPHCLLLHERETPRAKIYMSHHEKGCPPSWEEQPDLEYRVERTHCIVWLKSFCWVTIKVDDKDVLAKHLILYSCGEKLVPTDEHAVIAVGYYPDIEGEGKFLKLNKSMIVSERSPFVFMKEGSHPLCVVLVKHSPKWELWSPEKQEEISFEDIASSFEHRCKFILEKTDEGAKTLMCLFRVFQENGQQAVSLSVCPEKLDPSLDLANQAYKFPVQKQGNSPAGEKANVTQKVAEDFLPTQTKETSGKMKTQVDELLFQNSKYDELHPERSIERTSSNASEASESAVRPKLYKQRKRQEGRHDPVMDTLELYQPRAASRRGIEAQGQLVPLDDHRLFSHGKIGPLWPLHSTFQQTNYKQYFHIAPYGSQIGTTYCLSHDDALGQERLPLRYGVIKAISRKLDSTDPLGNDWRQLADELGFTWEEITTFESAPSSTFAVIDCAMKNGKIASTEQLKTILVKIGRSDAASVIRVKTPKDERKTASEN